MQSSFHFGFPFYSDFFFLYKIQFAAYPRDMIIHVEDLFKVDEVKKI